VFAEGLRQFAEELKESVNNLRSPSKNDLDKPETD
jgi:hypothetical protein